MPRVVMGRTIEFHYQSPNEMVSHLGESTGPLIVSFDTDTPVRSGDLHDVVIHIPWLGREVRLKGRVDAVNGIDDPRDGRTSASRVHLALANGPHDSIGHLREFLGRFRTGAILEDSHDATAPGATALSAEQRIRAMSPSLRAMLAAKANPEERIILSRDADPRVIEFLLKNPSLGLEEVRRLASRLNLHQGHFAMIGRNPLWMNDEMVRAALARNPRLPEFMAEPVLAPMTTAFLKQLAESMNTTASTRRVATRVLQMRGIVIGARRTQ